MYVFVCVGFLVEGTGIHLYVYVFVCVGFLVDGNRKDVACLTRVCVCMYVCMYVFMYVAMYVCKYMQARMYVAMYACKYMQVFAYIHTYIHTGTRTYMVKLIFISFTLYHTRSYTLSRSIIHVRIRCHALVYTRACLFCSILS